MMLFWILAGLLTAAVTGAVVTPLWREARILGLVLTFVIPLLALGLYFIGGAPDLAK
jgi:cytochrome c-type biogenesis protein CcmH/NrfG